MTKPEISEHLQKQKQLRETELGKFFVYLHARAWQLDERNDGYGYSASKAWKELEPVEKELRQRLMEIAGVK